MEYLPILLTLLTFALAFGFGGVLTGFQRGAGDCGDFTADVKFLYLGTKADGDTFEVEATTGNIITLTMDSLKYAVPWEFEEGSCSFTENGATDESGSFMYSPEIEWVNNKKTAGLREAISNLKACSSCGLFAIVEDFNGNKWSVGFGQDLATPGGDTTYNFADQYGRLRLMENNSTIAAAANNESIKLGRYKASEKPRNYTGAIPIAP